MTVSASWLSFYTASDLLDCFALKCDNRPYAQQGLETSSALIFYGNDSQDTFCLPNKTNQATADVYWRLDLTGRNPANYVFNALQWLL